MVRLARGVLLQQEDAQDVCQRVFLTYWQQKNQIKNPEAWLYRTAIHQAINLGKQNAARKKREELSNRSREVLPPDTQLELKESEEKLKRAIAELPTGQAQVFLLRHQGGLSYQEIAHFLQISLGTVKKQLHRALETLQSQLRKGA